MDWYRTVFEMIDMRSFSNLWYWIALAAVWSTASHYVLGVPYDMIARAARQGGQAEADLEALVRINAARLVLVARVSGLWMIGLGSMLLTGLALMGFAYDVEFAQATLLMGGPLVAVYALNVRTARRIRAEGLAGTPLRQRLLRHRQATQLIGMATIFVTAMWGMYKNLDVGPLG